MSRVAGFTAVCVGMCAVFSAQAAVLQGNPGTYRGQLSGLQPGDVLELEAGTYGEGLPIDKLNGQPGAWITIRGPIGGGEAIIVGRTCCNTVEISASSFVKISHLTLDGRNLAGPFGVNSRGPTHDITLADLKIIGHGEGQGVVGISTKGPAWNWIIRRNLIIGAGTGMYLGDSTGKAPFFGGLIEQNVILDSIGYNLQIKQQNPRPTDLGLPIDDHTTIIRHNVFSKQNNASMSGSRPNLLVGHLPLSGAGQDDLYEIYGNFFYENPGEALFQGEGNIALYSNVFVTTTGDAVNIVAHNHQPREVRVFQNTIIAADRGIRISGGDSGFTRKVLGNVVFAANPISAAWQSDNIVGGYAAAGRYLVAPGAGLARLDLYPLPNALHGTALDTGELTAYTDWALDFNGRVRDQRIRGAYGAGGQNPGWRLGRNFKALQPAGGGGAPR